jgi:NitT/TauT family transport system substrate-binding protein
MTIARRRFLTALAGTMAAGTMPGRTQGLDAVSVGYLPVVTDSPLFIAQANGYFRDAGLNVSLMPFDSAAFMIAPLGTGQLDAGAGAPAAGLYNAAARGIAVKMVANMAIDTRGYGFQKVVVRKSLVESGKYTGPASLRGMRLAQPAKGTASNLIAAAFLKTGGLNYLTDVETIYLGFADQIAALQNGAIDFTTAAEPFATIEANRGVGSIVATDDQFYPDQEIAGILYGGPFMRERPDVAKRFMVAYVRALRFYRGALKDGHLAGPNADKVIAIVAAQLKAEPALLRQITANDVNPDGRLNVASLQRDYDTFRTWGYVTEPVSVPGLVDMQYVDHAVQVLGKASV